MNKFKYFYQSIYGKFYVPLIFFLILTSGITYLYWIPHTIDYLINEKVQLIEEKLNTISHSIIPNLLQSELSNIYKTLDQIKSENEDWIYIQLTDSSNTVLYPLEEINLNNLSHNLKKISIKVSVQNEMIGHLTLVYNTKSIRKKVTSKFLSISFAIITLLLLFAILISLIIQIKLINPIMSLKKAIHNISIGNFNFTIKNKNFPIEISLLAESFLSMREKILHTQEELKEKNKQLEFINKNLEDLVEQRTNELEKTREQSLSNAKLASIGEMASGIAHEINNPVTIMDGQLRRLHQESIELNNSDIILLTNKIRKNLDRVVDIIAGMKKLSRDPSYDDKQIISLDLLFQTLKNLCFEKYHNSDIKISIPISNNGIEVLAKETHLLQVLLNLITNSADAICLEPRKWIKLDAYKVAKYCFIRLTDSGKGIDPEVQEKMFDPFYTTKETGKGTGLGLSLSKKIMLENEGDLFYETYQNHTSFVIKVPSGE